MSYQVLARKWRPQHFDDVSGQAHVTTPLRNAIRSDRVPHAILLTGPRGVGKTTLARILARCLNCDKGPTDTPCGECEPCREIIGGTSTDVQEIDAASRTSVDDVREVISAIRYAAAPGKYRIFVVDEVHMLSAAAFNALLKTLEEPPPRSLFVFATTNPEKIPFTVVSRCQRYDLRRISASEIVERLGEVTRAEKVEISPSSLLSIAREADGSMRDAQTLLDQVIAFGGSKIEDAQVAEVLDLIDRRVLLRVARACIDGDPQTALLACHEASDSGLDAKRLSENLLQLLRDLVVLRLAPEHPELIEAAEDEIAELRELAEQTDATRLRRMFRALIKEQEDLAWAPQPFAVLELALVRLATQPPGDDVGRLLARLDALEQRLGSGGGTPGGGGPTGGGGPGGGARSTSAPTEAARRGRKPASAKTRQPDAAPRAQGPPTPREAQALASPSPAPRAVPEAKAASPEPSAAGPHPSAASPAPSAASPAPSAATLATTLDRLRSFTREEHPGIFAALDGAALLEREAGRIRVRVTEGFAARRLREKQELLDGVASEFFGEATHVQVEDAESEARACAEEGAGGGDPDSRGRRARQAALNHPVVGRALDVLGADIVEILPLGPDRA